MEKKLPFEGPYTKTKGNVKDKSGAVHSPMSRARDLARKALKQKEDVKEDMQKADVPAYLRKQKGEKLTLADVKAPRKDSISHKANLAKLRNEEVDQIEESWQSSDKDTFKHKEGGHIGLEKELYTGGKDSYRITHTVFKLNKKNPRSGGDFHAKVLHTGTEKEMRKKYNDLKGSVSESVEEVSEATHVLSGDTDFMKKHAKAALEKVGAKISKITHDEDSGTSEYHVTHDQRDRIIHASKELEKKGKESYGGLVTNESAELDEARGRPRKNPAPAKAKGEDEDDFGPDKGPEPDQNIHQQLKRAADTKHEEVKGKEGFKTKGGAHVTFANGEKHFVHAEHAHKVLSALEKLKPTDRSKMAEHIHQSHAHFQAVHKLVS